MCIRDRSNVDLVFDGNGKVDNFVLYQNKPNPFKETTTISFNLPTASAVTVKIFDLSGKALVVRKIEGAKGYNEIIIDWNDLSKAGVFYYQLETSKHTDTKKMIFVK